MSSKLQLTIQAKNLNLILAIGSLYINLLILQFLQILITQLEDQINIDAIQENARHIYIYIKILTITYIRENNKDNNKNKNS